MRCRIDSWLLCPVSAPSWSCEGGVLEKIRQSPSSAEEKGYTGAANEMEKGAKVFEEASWWFECMGGRTCSGD